MFFVRDLMLAGGALWYLVGTGWRHMCKACVQQTRPTRLHNECRRPVSGFVDKDCIRKGGGVGGSHKVPQSPTKARVRT